MSRAELVYVHPNELQGSWDQVKEGLQKIHARASDGWIAEDVYAAIKGGNSTLHLCYVDQEYVGFIVLTPMQGYDVRKLHIWCAYNIGETSNLELFIAQLENMARSIGARKLTFASPRRWERRLPDFRLATTYYEKEV